MFTFRVELPPAVIALGFNETVDPAGAPETERFTVSQSPQLPRWKSCWSRSALDNGQARGRCANAEVVDDGRRLAVAVCGAVMVMVVLAELGSATLPLQLLKV